MQGQCRYPNVPEEPRGYVVLAYGAQQLLSLLLLPALCVEVVIADHAIMQSCRLLPRQLHKARALIRVMTIVRTAPRRALLAAAVSSGSLVNAFSTAATLVYPRDRASTVLALHYTSEDGAHRCRSILASRIGGAQPRIDALE